MAQGQSSIKGRGAEILVGVPKAVQVAPVESEPKVEPADSEAGDLLAPVAQEAQAPGTLDEPVAPNEPEVAKALYAEARDGEPVSLEGQDHWIMASEWPPPPEAELALLDEPVDVPETPATSILDAAPAVEESVEEEITPAEPLVPEASSQSASPQPVETKEQPLAAVDAYDIQSPEEPVEPLELPPRSLTAEQEKSLVKSASPRFEALDREIDEVYQQVLDEVGENESIATACFNLLLKARDIVLSRDAGGLPQAEYYVSQARARLKRASVSAVGARRNAWWILAWGLLWGMVFVATLILLDSQWVRDQLARLELSTTFVDPQILLPAMIWGGIGGVIAIWYSLFKHVAQRDFDRYYNISYVGKPFFGLVLGATVYMIIHLLIVSLGIWPGNVPSGIDSATAPTVAPWIIYLLAWASGFKENRVFGVVDEAMKRLFSTKGSTGSTSG